MFNVTKMNDRKHEKSFDGIIRGKSCRDAESSFFVGLRLRLRVKVGHRLLNLCDCDSVLREQCRQTNS